MPAMILSPELTGELEQVAAARDVKPEDLLAEAVRSYLRQLERDKIKAEAEAFRQLHPQLVTQYLGQYVAIHQGQLVDHGPEFEALHRRIRRQFGRQAVLIRRVTPEPERVLVMHSPRSCNLK